MSACSALTLVLKGAGSTDASTSMNTNLAGQVIAILPNGNLVVEAERMVAINNQKETMLVRGVNFAQAQETANQGLRHTVELLHKEYATRPFRRSPAAEGLSQDVSGRRGRSGDQLTKLPKMKAFLDHIIGGKTWRW